jgi:aspartyl protease family protein
MTESAKGERRIGGVMIVVACLILLGLLTLLFDDVLQKQRHPNSSLAGYNAAAPPEVVLKRNRRGHYVAPGYINGQPVRFLLDTGATRVSIPETVASRLGLRRGRPGRVSTANGTIVVYDTLLEQVSLGNVALRDVRADINPHMQGETVLLGMSFMKHLELVQRGDTMTLRQ